MSASLVVEVLWESQAFYRSWGLVEQQGFLTCEQVLLKRVPGSDQAFSDSLFSSGVLRCVRLSTPTVYDLPFCEVAADACCPG